MVLSMALVALLATTQTITILKIWSMNKQLSDANERLEGAAKDNLELRASLVGAMKRDPKTGRMTKAAK